ncbi:MAG: DUF4232 domain-containing protein [Gaiellaceae bacterium]
MRVLPAVVAALAASFGAGAGGQPQAAPCAGGQLGGRFAVVPNSGAAGSISYRLTLRNTSARICAVTGLPLGRLLGRSRRPLPTHVIAAHPGALTAVLVRLVPGDSTFAAARFSPDVPGPGEPVAGTSCEPTAYWFRVLAPGGGATLVKLVPPTPVCEHGTMSFTAYSHR